MAATAATTGQRVHLVVYILTQDKINSAATQRPPLTTYICQRSVCISAHLYITERQTLCNLCNLRIQVQLY